MPIYQLQSYEYSGAGWIGEVYEYTKGDWSWYLSIDRGRGGFSDRCHSFTSKESAERSMKARLSLLVEQSVNVQLGLPITY